MAKLNSPIKNLTRYLDRVSAPIYIVSTSSVVLYVNQACCDWIGLTSEEILSSKCLYSSQPLPDAIENNIKGLAPPPNFWHSESSQSSGSSELRTDVSVIRESIQEWRKASMSVLFGTDSQPNGILVICSDQLNDQPPETNPIKCSEQPELLHNALLKLQADFDRSFTLESLVGTSSYASRIRRQVDAAVNSSADLLITGPVGCGKEHVARTVHNERLSTNDANLTPVHCSIADQQLIQSNIKEMIDSQTNKHSTTQDWLLLLSVDELGEAAQNELLGFFELPNIAIRTIATATTPLVELAEEGKFNKELAGHLSTMTIDLVPLAQRSIDIPLLAQALLERDNARRESPLGSFSVEAMERLTEFNWPQNIDQLNRTIQEAAKNAEGNRITESDLPEDFQHALSAMRIGKPNQVAIDLDEYLGQIEKELITRALSQSKGNKSHAAKILGISRAKLLRRLQQLGLSESADPETPPQIDESAFKELDG